MKKIFLISAMFLLLVSCKSDWDSHFNEGGYDLANYVDGSTTEVLSITADEFFAQKQEFSDFYSLLRSIPDIDEALQKDQRFTYWIVENDNFGLNAIEEDDTVATMKLHVNNLAYNFSDLTDGYQLTSLGGERFFVKKLLEGNVMETYVKYDSKKPENTKITKSYILGDGSAVHVLSRLMLPQMTLYEYITLLSDDYSIIRDSLLVSTDSIFDLENSLPLGPNAQGNMTYDSIWILDNDLFDTVAFHDPGKMYTFMLYSNELIQNAMERAEEYVARQLEPGEKTEEEMQRMRDIWMQWILRASFYTYNGVNSRFAQAKNSEVQNATDADLKANSTLRGQTRINSARRRRFKDSYIEGASPWMDHLWDVRHQKEESNYAEPMPMSNGEVFFITDLRIPNYVVTREASYYVPATYPGGAYMKNNYLRVTVGWVMGEARYWKLATDEQKRNRRLSPGGLYEIVPELDETPENAGSDRSISGRWRNMGNFGTALEALGLNYGAGATNPVNGESLDRPAEFSVRWPALKLIRNWRDETDLTNIQVVPRYFPVGEYTVNMAMDNTNLCTFDVYYYNSQNEEVLLYNTGADNTANYLYMEQIIYRDKHSETKSSPKFRNGQGLGTIIITPLDPNAAPGTFEREMGTFELKWIRSNERTDTKGARLIWSGWAAQPTDYNY